MTLWTLKSRLLVPVALALTVGCAERAKLETGAWCDLTTECRAPLVCRLERCRRECRTSRDCPLGLDCVRDALELGACLLPVEARCDRPSDCVGALVCRFNRCTNSCSADEDCPPGSQCATDGTERGCRDLSTEPCALHSDCTPPLMCAPDLRCREMCQQDRDCRDGARCRVRVDQPNECVPFLDGGMDAATLDGAVDGSGDAPPG